MAVTAEQSPPEAGTYKIDPAVSSVGFVTRALFGMLPVRGSFTIGQGEITVAEVAEESSVEVAIEAAGFDSGNARRDEHVRSADYLDADRFPDITFRCGGVQRSGEGAALPGELTVRGVTQPVLLTVDAVAQDGERLTARGTATIDRYAFGITTAKGMTGRRLQFTVNVVANR
jgi:polyisoprenoid-binding protein YceI